jgi:O-antigen ligase
LFSSSHRLNVCQLETVSGGLIFLFPALLMVVPDGGSVVLLLLLLISFVGLVRNKKTQLPLNRHEIWLLAVVGAYLIINLLNVWIFNSPISHLDNASRFLLFLPIYFFIRKTNIPLKYVTLGILSGAVACFVMALYQFFYLGLYRAHGLQNAVPFGGLSITLGVMCLSIALTIENRWEKIGMYSGFLLAYIASTLSGTRGAWLVIPIVLITLFILNPRRWSVKIRLVGFLIALLIIALSYTIPLIQLRVDATILNLAAYFIEANSSTSIGLRLETWLAAIIGFSGNPVLGIGEGNFHFFLKQLAESGQIDPLLATRIAHTHNEFMSAMLHRGAPGLISTLLLFLLPLAIFYRQFKRQQGEKRVLMILGIMLIISSMITAVSDVFFGHQKQTLFYVTYIYLFYALACTDTAITVAKQD